MILRGRVLSFDRAPRDMDDAAAFSYHEDGAVVIEDGKISAVAPFETLENPIDVIDHRPHLIMPGFIDLHLHFPQVEVIGSYSAELLDWLNDYTFPAEIAFADPAHGAAMARAFFDELLRNGTTTPVAFCASQPASVEAYFAEAARRNICALGGKVMMDRGAPAALCDTAQSSYDDSLTLAQNWHRKGRARYAISPRFAITSTEAQLEAAAALTRALPDCHLQTHINETAAEIETVAQLFPKDADYLAVYERFGLVHERALLGHCIHMDTRQTARMAETRAVAVHCPTSNLFLGSGLFDKRGLEQSHVRTGVATDIGGGTSYSMLRTLDEAYKIAQLRRDRLDPLSSFYWMTRGNAESLGMVGEIGTLDAGSFADLVVLDAAATPAMALRQRSIESLAEELFLFQTMGDDRAVAAVYIAGLPQKPLKIASDTP